MATPQEIQDLVQELEALNSQLTGAAGNLQDDFDRYIRNTEGAAKNVAKSYKSQFTSASRDLNAAIKEIDTLVAKAKTGENVSSKLAKAREKVEAKAANFARVANNARKEGIDLSEEQIEAIKEVAGGIEDGLDNLDDFNTGLQKGKSLLTILKDSAGRFANEIDKSGTLSKLLKGNLKDTVTLSRLADASFFAIVKGTLSASDNINDLQKGLGISYSTSRQLQMSLGEAAINSEKLFLTSKDLNKAFLELTQSTGLIADFGGETLVTYSTLTKQLGLSNEEAGKLSLLSRIQDENTEDILDNTVRTVGSLVKQNGVAINVKGVLKDVANVSDAIAVSLGKNPELIAEAATEARLFGSNLEQVDKIASSLLDFESSIANELEAELLTGKQLNLEKARLLAINNDLAGLSQELANNEGIIEAFSTGNRIQQEAAASALGMSRDELAKIALQQDYINMSAEEFKDSYGDVTYQSLQAQSANEKFAATIEKVQGIVTDIGTILAPIVDGFASIVGYLAKSKFFANALMGVLSTLAIKSLVNAVATIFSASFTFGGPLGIALASAGVAGLFAATSAARQQVEDGIAPPGNGPFTITDSFGATAITAKGDGVAVSPNINRGSSDNGEQKRTNMLLEKLLTKDTNISMDGRRLNDSMQSSTVAYNIGV